MHWKESDAGHFVPKARGNSVYFLEENVHNQCFNCNINLGGNGSAYSPYIRKRYGEGYDEVLLAKARETLTYTLPELNRLIEVYKSKITALQ